jgi:hypothetical protein
MNASLVRGVLFDWRGTLFHDEEDVDWIRASAASIGRDLSVAQAMELLALVGTAGQHPDVIAARRRADCSVDLNRAATPTRCPSNTVSRNPIRDCSRSRWPNWALRLPKR